MKIAIMLLSGCSAALGVWIGAAQAAPAAPPMRLPRGEITVGNVHFRRAYRGAFLSMDHGGSIGDPTGPRVAPIALRTSHRAATTGRDIGAASLLSHALLAPVGFFLAATLLQCRFNAPRRYNRTRYYAPRRFYRSRYYAPGGIYRTRYYAPRRAYRTRYYAPRRAYRARYYAPRRAYRARAYAPRRAYRAVRCVGISGLRADTIAAENSGVGVECADHADKVSCLAFHGYSNAAPTSGGVLLRLVRSSERDAFDTVIGALPQDKAGRCSSAVCSLRGSSG